MKVIKVPVGVVTDDELQKYKEASLRDGEEPPYDIEKDPAIKRQTED